MKKLLIILLAFILLMPASSFGISIGYNGLPATITGNQTVNAVYGPEKVTNGSFASDTGWTKGANWTIASGVASKSSGALNNLSQDTGEVAGERYRVIYTVSALSAGSLYVSIGGVRGTVRIANGTYTEEITATGTGDLTFIPLLAAAVVSIDNVSVVLVTNGDMTVGGDLAITGGITKGGVTVSNPYTVNILDFGGVADNATDNGPALQAALNAIQYTGGTVVIPNGIWLFTTAVTFNQSVKSNVITITGTGNTKIKIAFPTYLATSAWNFVNVGDLTIAGLVFIRTSASGHDAVDYYIKITGTDTHYVLIQNIEVAGAYPAYGLIRVEDAIKLVVRNCSFLGIAMVDTTTTHGVFLLKNTHLNLFEDNIFYDLYYNENSVSSFPASYNYPRYWININDATSYSNGAQTGMQLIIRGNLFDENISTAQINLSPVAGAIEYALIENNYFNYAQNNVSVVQPSIYAYGTANPSIKNLIIRGNKWSWTNASKPVDITKTTYALIENNNMPSPGLGIFANNTVTKLHVRNNTINGGVTSTALQTIIQPASMFDFSSGSTVPVVSTCGTTPAIATGSNDYKGIITVGSGVTTACTVTFGTAKTSEPSCNITPQANVTAYFSAKSNTAFTVTFSADMASTKFNYDCAGINEQ